MFRINPPSAAEIDSSQACLGPAQRSNSEGEKKNGQCMSLGFVVQGTVTPDKTGRALINRPALISHIGTISQREVREVR